MVGRAVLVLQLPQALSPGCPCAPALLLPQATPVKAGRPAGILLSTPYLRIRVAQRAPYKPAQARAEAPACQLGACSTAQQRLT